MRRIPTELLLIPIVSILCYSSLAWGAEVYIPPVQARSGSDIMVPIMIDQVDNLAGVKLVLSYDSNILQFVGGTKTKYADSLMHIINDKKPGVLVIVMAGAMGIGAKNFPIMELEFVVRKGLKGNHETSIVFKEVQLMSDELEEIRAKARENIITILPAGPPPPDP